MKKIISCVLFAILAAGISFYLVSGFAEAVADGMDATVYPTPYFAVMDASNVITPETARYIDSEVRILKDRSGAEFYLATVPGCSPDCNTYATDLFNTVGVGDAAKNNGVLLLLDSLDHHTVLRIGSGIEDVIPDGKAGRILDEHAVAAVKADKWNLAALNTFAAVMTELYGKYQLPVPVTVTFHESASEVPREQYCNDPVPLPPPPENFWIGLGTGIICFIFLLWRICFHYYRDPAAECTRWKGFLLAAALFLLDCLLSSGSGKGGSGGSGGGSHGGGGTRGGGACR
ncbi:TPM domain-containing protein [Succinimonas amylolytica]|uniref:TPM domain-containing protein n=1 Tax=Succinimonas amylolytica TaxID=83769 RepID=UPI00037FAD1E|nr:TPM domain-containing protein [Succinimonas amylolytica]